MSDQTSEVPRPPSAHTAPDITAPLPVQRGSSLRPGQVALAFIAVAAGAFLLGVAIATSDGGRPDGEVLAEVNVGPAGRTITFDRGEIAIPRGAVRRTVRVIVTKSDVGGHAYGFAPTDVTFLRPVRITLRLPDGARNGAIVNKRGGGTALLGGEVGGGAVTVEVTDLAFEGTDL